MTGHRLSPPPWWWSLVPGSVRTRLYERERARLNEGRPPCPRALCDNCGHPYQDHKRWDAP